MPHKPKIAVMYFPGNNCEEETKDRCIDVGMDARIVRWNTKENLSDFDGYIIPGGFSYEDRIRAGVIAAKEKVMDKIRDEKKKIIKIPVAHGEGRFTTKDKSLIKQLEKNKQITFKYCNEKGQVINKFPINPNGAVNNIAAISNKEGNIMAMMPHPERASYNWMIPEAPKNDERTNAIKIFESMKWYILKNCGIWS